MDLGKRDYKVICLIKDVEFIDNDLSILFSPLFSEYEFIKIPMHFRFTPYGSKWLPKTICLSQIHQQNIESEILTSEASEELKRHSDIQTLKSLFSVLSISYDEEIKQIRVVKIEAINLLERLDCLFRSLKQNHHTVSTSLPVEDALALVDADFKSIPSGYTKTEYMGENYTLTFFNKDMEPFKSLVQVHKDITLISKTPPDDDHYFTTVNARLIFDRFYGFVRGRRHNGEYTYGKSVSYYLTTDFRIVHHFIKDDLDREKNEDIQTVVLRLGDRLTQEMIDFLKRPVAGHETPKVLFEENKNEIKKNDIWHYRNDMDIALTEQMDFHSPFNIKKN